MPLYKYEAEGQGCSHCQSRFEVLQRVDQEPLTRCPECGQLVRRVFSSCAISRAPTGTLSPKNLERHGFTQYRKAGDGYYEKTCGPGPDLIKRR